jgi:hypothetical protein
MCRKNPLRAARWVEASLDVTDAAQSLFQTDDPVIVLYARLERLLPRTPDKILNLM